MNEQILYEIVLRGGEDVTRRIEQVSKELGEARKAAKSLSDQLDDPANKDSIDDLTAAYKMQTQTIAKLGAEYKDLSTEQRRQTNIALEGLKKENGSIAEKSTKLANLKAAYRQLSEAQRNDISVGGVHLRQIQRLDQEVKDLDASIGNYQRNVGNYSNLKQGIGDALGGLGGGVGNIVQAGMAGGPAGLVAAGVGVTIAGALAAAEQGAKLEQQMMKNTQVLGASLGMVDAEARKVAIALGLTENEFIANTAAVADLLKPMGFTTEAAAQMGIEVTKLSAPLAAWSKDQKTASEVTDTVIAALTGEREGLKSLGIVIDESTIKAKLAEKGQQGLTGAALKQAEAQIVLEEVTRQSADALATYASNTNSLSRQNEQMSASWRDLKQNLLEGFLPVIRTVIGALADATAAVVRYIKEVGTFSSMRGFTASIAEGAARLTGNQALATTIHTNAMVAEQQRQQSAQRQRDIELVTKIMKEENKTAQEAYALMIKRREAADGLTKSTAASVKVSQTAIKEQKAESGSVRALADELSEMRKELERTSSASPKFQSLIKQVQELEERLATARRLMSSDRSQGQTVTAPMSGLNLIPSSIADPTAPAAIPSQVADIKKAQIEENDELRKQEYDKTKEGIDTLNAIAVASLEISSAIAAVRLQEIDERYAREIAAAKGNATLIASLEKRRDAEKAKIERQAFERAKKLQTAAALIQLASGIVNILASPTVIPSPFGEIFKGIQIAALTATTAAQIAQINAAQFKEGGFTSSGNDNEVAGVVHKNEYVIPARVLSTPEGAETARMLEDLRTGKTRRLTPQVYGSKNIANEIAAGVTAAIQSIPVVVTQTDLDSAAAKRTIIQQSARL